LIKCGRRCGRSAWEQLARRHGRHGPGKRHQRGQLSSQLATLGLRTKGSMKRNAYRSSICASLDRTLVPPSCFPSDTVFKVIHPAARKPNAAPQATVNNFAAPLKTLVNKKDVSVAKNLRPGDHRSGRLAPDTAWSFPLHSERVRKRTPAGPRAPVQKSERTAP